MGFDHPSAIYIIIVIIKFIVGKDEKVWKNIRFSTTVERFLF
jgi:hypothetical protein